MHWYRRRISLFLSTRIRTVRRQRFLYRYVAVFKLNKIIVIFFYKSYFSDIDECAIETHKCRSGKICVNNVGSYKCVDDPTLPKTESKPKTNINCPTGYKANKENLVCDGWCKIW